MSSIPDASSDSGAERRLWLDGLAETVLLGDGRSVVLRPITSEDEAAHFEFAKHVTPTDAHFRFFRLLSEEALRAMLTKISHIDYEKEMAFIAVDENCVPPITLGVVRAVKLPDSDDAEFAILVRSDMKGIGLGHLLMRKIIDYSRSAATHRLIGEMLIDNHQMQRLARRLGFTLASAHADVIEATLVLRADGAAPDKGI
jgi:acetyltransferase